jgi:diphthine-ammonia ligase
MLECGMEVILVKVAGVGLGIDLVGKNLREIMPLLRRLVSRFLFGRS